jgi:hypothetical protein
MEMTAIAQQAVCALGNCFFIEVNQKSVLFSEHPYHTAMF